MNFAMTLIYSLLLITTAAGASTGSAPSPQIADQTAAPSDAASQPAAEVFVNVRYIQVDSTKLRLSIEGYRPSSADNPLPAVSTNAIRVEPADAMRDTSADLLNAREFGTLSLSDGDPDAPRFEGAVLNGSAVFKTGLNQTAWSPGRQSSEAGAKPETPEGIKVLVCPALLISSGKSAGFSSGFNRAYLADEGGGCLRLKWMASDGDDPIHSMTEGVSFKALVALQHDGTIKLDPMTLVYRRMIGREPIDGVPFDVGRPIIKTQKMSISLVINQKATAVFAFPRDREDDALILALVQAYEVKQGPATERKGDE